MNHHEKPTHADLFAGIGGFALGAEWAGYRTVVMCELDPYCQQILIKNFGCRIAKNDNRLPKTTIGTLAHPDSVRPQGVLQRDSEAEQSRLKAPRRDDTDGRGTALATPNAMDGMAPRSQEALTEAKSKGGCSNLKDMTVHPSLYPTSETSTGGTSTESTSSQVDFLASLSAMPGSAGARKMTVTSGRRCSALLRRRDPLGCLVKMLLGSSRWNSTVVFLTWKVSATPFGRCLFQLAPWEPSTAECASGSSDDESMWRTPNTMDSLEPKSPGGPRPRSDGGASGAQRAEQPARPAGREGGTADVGDTARDEQRGLRRARIGTEPAASTTSPGSGCGSAEGVPDPKCAGLEGGSATRDLGGEGAYRDQQSSGHDRTQEWCQWILEPAVCGVADGLPAELVRYAGRVATGVPNRVAKLRALGNSVVPQLVYEILKIIVDIDSQQNKLSGNESNARRAQA